MTIVEIGVKGAVGKLRSIESNQINMAINVFFLSVYQAISHLHHAWQVTSIKGACCLQKLYTIGYSNTVEKKGHIHIHK